MGFRSDFKVIATFGVPETKWKIYLKISLKIKTLLKYSKELNLKILIIIPCYNEEGSISKLLDEINLCEFNLTDVWWWMTVLSDRTFDLASEYCDVIRLPKNLGIGGAVQTGIRYAYDNDYDVCLQVVGIVDRHHPPEEIYIAMWRFTLKWVKCSIVIGSGCGVTRAVKAVS